MAHHAVTGRVPQKGERVKGSGRITNYKPEFCEMLIEHMSKGNTFETFTYVAGIKNKDTLNEWVKKHPEFADAKSVGRQAFRLWLENLVKQHIVSVRSGEMSTTLNSRIVEFYFRYVCGVGAEEQSPVVNNVTVQSTVDYAELIKVARGQK